MQNHDDAIRVLNRIIDLQKGAEKYEYTFGINRGGDVFITRSEEGDVAKFEGYSRDLAEAKSLLKILDRWEACNE